MSQVVSVKACCSGPYLLELQRMPVALRGRIFDDLQHKLSLGYAFETTGG
jgi:hypothetical protein